METIAQNLQKLIDSKAAIKQSLINKGQEVGDVFSEYVDAVYNIPQSGGSSDYKPAVEGTLTGSVTISEGVTAIRPYRFSGCKITSVKLPESLTTIGDSAFKDTLLTSVTLGSNITSIGTYAFLSVSEATIKAVTPPSISRYSVTFPSSISSIYVPDESVETYKTASGWSKYYADKIKPISEKGN